ncbi:hypothetical protein COU74_05125 [Candidatus Peregrinibacteria bacterium CG10_big_fil_rev_8_21_14_0_10_36_19]|nr:MAG: hypothetical protein COU74_05125 [Candidatus Peregrinibacteria bacterium CG10_big_fil_rev_8_21_14_0_10_36_19]
MIEQKPHPFIFATVIAAVSFLFGWQATSFGYIEPTKLFASDSVVDTRFQENIADAVDMDLFWLVWKELEKKYVNLEATDEKGKVYGAVKGLVDAYGDPYTAFMTPDESKSFSESLEGTLEGIGAELVVEDQMLTIVSPLRDSPAEKAGLLPGDIIYKIEDEIASDMSLFDAITKIRGEKGTTVNLTIVREGVEKPFEVSIVRQNINIDSVTSEKLDGDIAYLSVNQFNDKTNEQFGAAISEMLLDEPKGLIVDLRYNSGGYLDVAVEILSYLLDKGKDAVIIKERGKEDTILKTNGNPKLLNVPLVVLINKGSASASEIVAGGIQDYKRGVIMGTQSFGKGSVQEVESFSDGSSLRLTIAKWFTPKGRTIDHVGLVPDIIVEQKESDKNKKADTQKEYAANYLRKL